VRRPDVQLHNELQGDISYARGRAKRNPDFTFGKTLSPDSNAVQAAYAALRDPDGPQLPRGQLNRFLSTSPNRCSLSAGQKN
jgi:hypothetical protein